jgi:hypothetical protein
MNAPERRSPAVRRDVLAAHDDRYELSTGRSSADVRTDAASYIPGGYVTGEPATEGALHHPHGVPRVSVATAMRRDVEGEQLARKRVRQRISDTQKSRLPVRTNRHSQRTDERPTTAESRRGRCDTLAPLEALSAEASGISKQQFHDLHAARTHAPRLSTLAELSDAAVFIASDKASGLTGTIVNLSLGSLDD